MNETSNRFLARYVRATDAQPGANPGFPVKAVAPSIRVNSLSPGLIETPIINGQFATKDEADGGRKMFKQITPLGRVGRPEEMAAAILFLASDDSSYSTGIDLVAVVLLARLRVKKVQPPAGTEPHPGAIGRHSPLPCVRLSFQSFCPPSRISRSGPAPVFQALRRALLLVEQSARLQALQQRSTAHAGAQLVQLLIVSVHVRIPAWSGRTAPRPGIAAPRLLGIPS